MLMEIHDKENTKSRDHAGEALECNRNFYAAGKNLGLYPKFVHTDKDWSEISAAQVSPHLKRANMPREWTGLSLDFDVYRHFSSYSSSSVAVHYELSAE
jgi:hypothetical protein